MEDAVSIVMKLPELLEWLWCEVEWKSKICGSGNGKVLGKDLKALIISTGFAQKTYSPSKCLKMCRSPRQITQFTY
jgi:hypothetical protein